MVTGADRPAKDTQIAAAETIQQTAVSSKLHEDVRHLHIVETPAGRLIELKVGPDDTLLNLGRELYRKYTHHDPSKDALRAFEADAARRNNLLTTAARDHLYLGQPLKLSLPGVTLPHAEKAPPLKAVSQSGHPPKETTVKAEPAKAEQVKAAQAKAITVQPETPGSRAQALMKGSSSCSGEWSNMVAQWVTHNEVSQQKFVAFNPNDHGAGISIGLLQWNQKKGRLPELLQDWHQKDPGKFDRIFGSYAANLLKPDWVRSADFVGTPTLNNGIHAALADGEFQQVQLSLRNEHIVKSCEVAQSNGFTSLRGRAVVADLFNQIGERGTEHALHKVPKSKPESARIEELKKITGGRVNGHDRVTSIEENVKNIWRQLGSQ